MRWWQFGRRLKQRQQMTLDKLLAESSPPTWAGVLVGTDQAMRLSAVWACVRLLADSVSTLPVDVFQRGQRAPLEPPPLLVAPAAAWALHDWLEAVMRSLLLRGNAYGLVVARGTDLRPTQVELIHPDQMGVRVTDEGLIDYRLGGKPLAPEDVWHVKAYRMAGLVVGLSPVEYARQAIGLGLAAEKFGAQFFGDNATPGGVLETDVDLDDDAAADLKERWKALLGNRRDIAVMDNGLRFRQVTIAPEEAQFVETQKLNVASIARVFGVPPEMIAGDVGNSLTYANVEQRALDFLTFGLRPWLVRLEAAVGSLLPQGQYLRFNSGALLKATLKDRYEAHEIGLRAGFLTVNEVRELEDRPPLEDAA
jgi:HK97 family phage portal protein